jgi:hypothetical protein
MMVGIIAIPTLYRLRQKRITAARWDLFFSLPINQFLGSMQLSGFFSIAF